MVTVNIEKCAGDLVEMPVTVTAKELSLGKRSNYPPKTHKMVTRSKRVKKAPSAYSISANPYKRRRRGRVSKENGRIVLVKVNENREKSNTNKLLKSVVRKRKKAKAEKSREKIKRIQEDYKRYYETRRSKFGWGLDQDILTKEQMFERAKLKVKSFERNECHWCKVRFRMRYRLKLHMKKQNCCCKDCGYVYKSAFERSDHKDSCTTGEDEHIKNKPAKDKAKSVPTKDKTAIIPPMSVPNWRRPLRQALLSPIVGKVEDCPDPLHGIFIPDELIPSLTIPFCPTKTEPTLSPIKYESDFQENCEPSFMGMYDSFMDSHNVFDSEIKNIVAHEMVDIVSDF